MSKRSRRGGVAKSHLKKFSSTVVGGTSQINKHYFQEAANRAHAMSHKDIAFMRLFGLEPTPANEQARKARGEAHPFLIETPRDRVLRQLSEALQEVNPLHNISLIPKTLYMFWDDHGYYFLVKYDHTNGTCMRSLKYGSRDRLMFAFNTNSVHWK